MVYTVGHSTRPWTDFLALLQGHSIDTLWDVRTVPRSRRNPQFNTETMGKALPEQSIDYCHVAGLGGFRKTSDASPNNGWRNASFRGYADYMQTAEFFRNLTNLMTQAHNQRIALMCAEAVPWRCHRSLIADALIAHGVSAQEILSPSKARPHKLTSFARIQPDGRILYPTDGT